MTDRMLAAIGAAFPLAEQDCGENALQKHSGMSFRIRSFHAQGLGHVSVMTASGFFGLMKMDTLIINPTERDVPLFSYDRVLAMGNDTLIYELYDTLVDGGSLACTEAVRERYAALPDHDLGAHWYDSIKLPVSLSKKGKKPHRAAFDSCAMEYLEAFLQDAAAAAPCDPEAKREKGKVYVEGLLKNGGPSTDVFLKGIGRDKTEFLFRKILFGTEV